MSSELPFQFVYRVLQKSLKAKTNKFVKNAFQAFRFVLHLNNKKLILF
jgi:hypothetical protein